MYRRTLKSYSVHPLNSYVGFSLIMAKTNDGKKKVYVKPHTKKDGTEVKRHYRSTPK